MLDPELLSESITPEFLLLRLIVMLIIYICGEGYVSVSECRCPETPEALEPQKLELQAVMCYSARALGTTLTSSARGVYTLSC